MKNFEFFTPTRIIFDKSTRQQVGKIVKGYGFKKVLVHFGGASVRKSGLLDAATGALEAEGIQYVTPGGVQANPTLAKARGGIELCLREGVDPVPVAGGGSVIGSAKCIADGAGNPDADVWTYFRQEVVPARALPMGVILTPSAPSSKMSVSCAITDEEDGFRRGLDNVIHRPLFFICNPESTCTVSKYQTACGTVNIMMHALERYFSRTKDTELMDRIAEVLLRSTVEAGRIADKEPDNHEARAVLMWGGSLSHNGPTGAGRDLFTQVYQLEYELSDMYPFIAHGAGLAALWPSWAGFVCPGDVNRLARYTIRVRNIDMDFDCPMSTALAGIRAMEDFHRSLGMSSSLEEFGVEEERLEEMTEKCTNMGKRTLSGIRELGKEEVMEIYRMAIGE